MGKDKLIRTLNEYSVDGYESPIHMVTNDIRLKVENGIAKAVLDVGIDVNKEELLKALRYDRKQYDKGYRDGINAQRWIPCSERPPEDMQKCLTTAIIYFVPDHVDENDNYVGVELNTYSEKYGWLHNKDVLAWMPLPEPYKAGGQE